MKKIFQKFYDLIMTNKYKKVLLVLLPVILCLVVLLILTSSGFMKAKVGNGAITDVNVSTCGTMTLSDSNPINLQNSYPMTDNRGLQTTPYTFTITNTCDVSSSFMVYLVILGDSEIDPSLVKYNLDTTASTGLVTTLEERTFKDGIKSQFQTKTGKTVSKVYLLDTHTLTKGTSQTFNLRMWLDKDDTNDIMGKTFIAAVAVGDSTNTSNEYDIHGIASKLDGIAQTTFPSGLKGVTSTCSNSNSRWDYENNKLKIYNITGSVNCSYVSFTTPSTTNYFNNYLINLAGTSQGDGQLVSENGYRYEGSNPNNYVWYNGEMWRIIGVFGSSVHGVSGSNLVKLIKADSIGGLVYDQSGTNTWGSSSLYNLLNNYYYNGTDYTNKANGTYCSSYKGYTPGNCNYSKTGIRYSNAKNMIEQASWYTTVYTSIGTPEVTYGYDTTTTTSTTGYIGLMYPSDYGYAPLASVCARTISLGSYNGSTNGLTCSGQNWLKYGEYEWTIAQYSTSLAWYVIFSGLVNNTNLYQGIAVRPSLYLKSNVYYVSGTGAYTDPYIIGI